MQALIVHAHPERQSFNGALTSVARDTLTSRGYDVEISDLYAQDFNPVEGPGHYRRRADDACFTALAEQRHAYENNVLPIDVAREVDRLKRADVVVFQFPLWWHSVPAILKGWFDRVFVSGGLYTSRMRYDKGFFRGKTAVVSVTTGAPSAAFGPGARGGDMDQMLWPVHYSLHYMGFTVLPPFLAHGIQGHGYAYQDDGSYREQLEAYKECWSYRLNNMDGTGPMHFPGWDDWDAQGGVNEMAADA